MSPDPRPDPAWAALERRYPGHPHLSVDPLYSLSRELIRLLREDRRIEFGDEDAAFETDLLNLTRGGGFYRRIPFDDPLRLDPFPPDRFADPSDTPSVRTPDPFARLFEPYNYAPRDTWVESEELRTEGLDQRRAYAAWLVGDSRFQRERDELFSSFGHQHAGYGGLPREPDPTDLGRSPWDPTDDYNAYRLLNRRWCLERMATWDLPTPQYIERLDANGRMTVNTPGAGLTLTVPWYALRGGRLDVRTWAEGALNSPDLSHLAGWLNPRKPKKGQELGRIRLNYQYLIYRYWVLAINSRYEERLAGRLGDLDRLVSRLIGADNEVTVRKNRRQITTRAQTARHLETHGTP